LAKVYLAAPDCNGLRHAQPVTVDHHEQQVIAYTVPAALGSLEQPIDLVIGEEVLGSFVTVGDDIAAPTLYFSPVGQLCGSFSNPRYYEPLGSTLLTYHANRQE